MLCIHRWRCIRLLPYLLLTWLASDCSSSSWSGRGLNSSSQSPAEVHLGRGNSRLVERIPREDDEEKEWVKRGAFVGLWRCWPPGRKLGLLPPAGSRLKSRLSKDKLTGSVWEGRELARGRLSQDLGRPWSSEDVGPPFRPQTCLDFPVPLNQKSKPDRLLELQNPSSSIPESWRVWSPIRRRERPCFGRSFLSPLTSPGRRG